MTKDALNDEYFEWMRGLVCNEMYSKRLSYRKLSRYLHDIEFRYIVSMDGNRAEDGIAIRYRFCYEHDYPWAIVSRCFDSRPCSILEMMIALSIRCEEHIMDDPDIGDRTGQWFWNMVTNLGLGGMNDANFDKVYVDRVVSRFLNRDYEPNGKGGLFTVKNNKYDLRTAEIWYQMCWYLDGIVQRT